MPKPTRAPLANAEATLREISAIIARGIEERAPGYGFAMVIMSYGEAGDGFFTHVSNCNRDDLIKLLEEWRSKLIARQDSPTGMLDREN